MPDRTKILNSLRQKSEDGQPLRLGFATPQLSPEAAAQYDLLLLYHANRFPNSSLLNGLFPFEDANAVVLEQGKALAPLIEEFPVVAGVCGTDPFRLLDKFLEQIKKAGFVGVQNFPTLGMMDGSFRAHLENSQIGYGKEVEMIRQASALGLLTTALVFNFEEAEQMSNAGADVLVFHPGAKAFRKEPALDDFVKQAEKMAAKIQKVRRDIILFRYDKPGEWAGLI
jgi:predicted TIM-barrel enzyme